MKRHFQKAGLRKALQLHFWMLVILACFLTIYVDYFAEDMQRLYEIYYQKTPADAQNIVLLRLSILWAAALPLCLSFIFDRGYVLAFAILFIVSTTGHTIDFIARQSIDWDALPSYEKLGLDFLLWKANIVFVARLLFIGFIWHGLLTSYQAFKRQGQSAPAH